MRLLIPLLSLLLALPVRATDFETANDAVSNMGVGWNLGNTLDANNGSKMGLESETCWGQPVTRPELMTMMKEAGFGAIRVPVTWEPHLDAIGNVDAEWMNRVHEVVDYVIDAGLYCILNLHHDTGAGDYHWLHASMDIYNDKKARYEKLWQQIADEFKDYGERLLFESYNEMLDKYDSWCFATFASPSGYNTADAVDAYNAINSYAQSFVDVVRASGGNNAQRNLIVNTYGACDGRGSWSTHLIEPLKEMKRPSDTVNDHIIFEIHTYPSIVKTDANNNVTGTRPLSDIKTEIEDMLSGIKTHLVAKGAPVIFGEWGTSNVDGAETDYVARRDMLLLFVDFFVKQTKQAGIGTFFWMGLSDGSVRTLPAFNQPDLAEAIVKAYHGNSYEGKYPKESDFSIEYIVNYISEWSEAQLFSGSAPLATYVGARLEMSEMPEAGTLKIKCYGDANGREQYDELSANSLNTTITFRQSEVGEKVTRITLQTFVGPTTAKIRRTMLIRHDGTEVEYKPSVFWGCDVTSASVSDIIQPFVSSDDAWKPVYNLYGQRISVPGQGIYVCGGRKFVVF